MGGGEGAVHEGFWMPASGNDGVAAIEIFHMSAASAVTVKMETKSSDGTDTSPTPTTIGTQVVTSTTPDVTRFPVEDAQDLVRYTVTVSATSSAHFQLCQPLWAPN